MSKASNDALDTLHATIAEELADRIKRGEATAADLSVAVKFLKDNGITVSVQNSPAVNNLIHSLPFTGDEEDHMHGGVN